MRYYYSLDDDMATMRMMDYDMNEMRDMDLMHNDRAGANDGHGRDGVRVLCVMCDRVVYYMHWYNCYNSHR